jgi:hypothetical protein
MYVSRPGDEGSKFSYQATQRHSSSMPEAGNFGERNWWFPGTVQNRSELRAPRVRCVSARGRRCVTLIRFAGQVDTAAQKWPMSLSMLRILPPASYPDSSTTLHGVTSRDVVTAVRTSNQTRLVRLPQRLAGVSLIQWVPGGKAAGSWT